MRDNKRSLPVRATPPSRKRSTAAVWLQVLALALLQLAGIASHVNQIGRSPAPSMICRGDHTECGCSPERVANESCCCSRQIHASCAKKKEQAVTASPLKAKGDGTHSEIAWHNLPCGGGAKYVGFSFSKVDLVLPEPPRVAVSVAESAGHSPLREASPDDFLITPPTPPPESMPLS
jgi:hypothetical protein